MKPIPGPAANLAPKPETGEPPTSERCVLATDRGRVRVLTLNQPATRIGAGPPLALAGIKAMLARWPADPGEILEWEVDLQAKLMDTDDFGEGIAAFRERRKPVFRGR